MRGIHMRHRKMERILKQNFWEHIRISKRSAISLIQEVKRNIAAMKKQNKSRFFFSCFTVYSGTRKVRNRRGDKPTKIKHITLVRSLDEVPR